MDLLHLAEDKDLDKVAYLILHVEIKQKHNQIITLCKSRTDHLDFDGDEVLNYLHTQKSGRARMIVG